MMSTENLVDTNGHWLLEFCLRQETFKVFSVLENKGRQFLQKNGHITTIAITVYTTAYTVQMPDTAKLSIN